MLQTQSMLGAHPLKGEIDVAVVGRCIEACWACADTCNQCADACLAEDMVAELTTCIRLNLDCSAVCGVTASLLGRLVSAHSAPIRSQLEACLVACNACGEECAAPADMHAHCRICADACRRCEEACRRMMAHL